MNDDYLEKYIDVFSYIVARGIDEKYSTSFIEQSISYSSIFSQFERSNITLIAFSSNSDLYRLVFPNGADIDFHFDKYGVYGWLGYLYINLFLSLEITFETLFIILPIKKAMNMYSLYHEMDYRQSLEYVKETVKYSYFDTILKAKKITSKELSINTGISLNTIKALRFNNRDINKLESKTLYRLASSLSIKTESLLTSLDLKTTY